jgi:hypothetical protein
MTASGFLQSLESVLQHRRPRSTSSLIAACAGGRSKAWFLSVIESYVIEKPNGPSGIDKEWQIAGRKW